jgi:hypothetical protein
VGFIEQLVRRILLRGVGHHPLHVRHQVLGQALRIFDVALHRDRHAQGVVMVTEAGVQWLAKKLGITITHKDAAA